jgi:myo-inositol 2-dehydrogenase/D-chiro-inositol 1-dehydrogenase
VAARLALGLVGVGRIGVLHARTLLALEGVSLTVADADPGRARRVAAELGIQAAETPEELLAAGVDGLVIATATAGHAPLVRLAAGASVPVFCEKPVALDLPTMDDLIAAADTAGIVVHVGFQRRFDAGYRAAHDAVAGGDVGRILLMRAATHDPAPPPREYLASSGGIFRDLHIHDFDAIRFVSGQEVTEVYAAGAVLETPWLTEQDDVDVAAAVLRLGSGALVILSGTRHDPLGYDVRLEVFGTRDSIVAGQGDRSPIRSVEPAAGKPAGPGYRDFWDRFEPAYRQELAVFVNTVTSGGPSACPLAEARAALAVALAADRSRAERQPVPVN